MTDPLRERAAAALRHQYLIEDEIGRGGMSVVYRARDLRLERVVAIKVLPPELAHDPAVGSRFTREAQTSAQLSHAHIVPIYDVGERDGIAYFVMALISGGNLAVRLERQPLQPVDEVRRILCETADALAYAHLRGVIHRDIKADNILLDADSGRAMVTDFGIARAMEGGTRLTLTGIAVGTPTYMSPEQALGEREIDGRSDIYSLGVLGYQMLTGRVPFSAGNSMALLLKHVSERPRPIAELRPEAPRQLCDVIERALKKAAEDRWPTAGAMRDALLTEGAAPSWRVENREPLRYTSPVPRGARREARTPSPRAGSDAAERPATPVTPLPGAIELEPRHLAALTEAQRVPADPPHPVEQVHPPVPEPQVGALRTAGMSVGIAIAFGFGASESPLLLAPLVPMYMTGKLWKRGRSLRAAGVKLRRAFFMPRVRSVLPSPPVPSRRQLRKLAPRVILESAHGAAIRRAAEDRAAILDILGALSKADRALLPEVVPTVNGLVERVAHLAKMLHRLDTDFDPGLVAELDARIAGAGNAETSGEQRRLGLLRRQRGSAEEFVQQRAMLARQLESAGLALGNLRLDLVRLRSSGLEAGLNDVSSATREAKALSREIGVALEAAAEVRHL